MINTCEERVLKMFTVYILKSVEGIRKRYLKEKTRRNRIEREWEEAIIQETPVYFEDFYDREQKEYTLKREIKGGFPKWNELSDLRLVSAIQKLKPEEKMLLYMHLFEEKSFIQISQEMGLPHKKVVNRYYYTIKKVRSLLGGRDYAI